MEWIGFLIPGAAAGLGAMWGSRIRAKRLRNMGGDEDSSKRRTAGGTAALNIALTWLAGLALMVLMLHQGAPWWILVLIGGVAVAFNILELRRL